MSEQELISKEKNYLYQIFKNGMNEYGSSPLDQTERINLADKLSNIFSERLENAEGKQKVVTIKAIYELEESIQSNPESEDEYVMIVMVMGRFNDFLEMRRNN